MRGLWVWCSPTWVILPCSFTLKKAPRSFETSVTIYQYMRSNIVEDTNLKSGVLMLTTALVCSMKVMWKDKLHAGHAFCVSEDIFYLDQTHVSQSFVHLITHLFIYSLINQSIKQSINQPINQSTNQPILTQAHDRQAVKLNMCITVHFLI